MSVNSDWIVFQTDPDERTHTMVVFKCRRCGMGMSRGGEIEGRDRQVWPHRCIGEGAEIVQRARASFIEEDLPTES